jgi:uncharacterized membrane protein YfcA
MVEELVGYLGLCLSAAAGGAVNAIAGGGTLLTFPSLMAALASRPEAKLLANTTSTVALLPGSAASVWGYRREMKQLERWSLLLLAPSLLGGTVGAILLVSLPETIFNGLVPWLILTAALLFLAQPALARWFGIGKSHGPPTRTTIGWILGFQFLVAVYGGYFGAGIGILMLSSLGLMGIGDIHTMNAVKNTLAASINAVAVIVFVFEGDVSWKLAAPMVIAAVIGGYGAAHLARYLNKTLVRGVVILIGVTLTLHYFMGR